MLDSAAPLLKLLSQKPTRHPLGLTEDTMQVPAIHGMLQTRSVRCADLIGRTLSAAVRGSWISRSNIQPTSCRYARHQCNFRRDC